MEKGYLAGLTFEYKQPQAPILDMENVPELNALAGNLVVDTVCSKEEYAQQLIEKKLDVIEQMQEVIVAAGGKFYKQHELRKMTIEEFLDLVIPNSIKVSVKYKP